MTQQVGIIGGGIIGLCSAYYLQKSGYQVSIFERNDIGMEASYGNAGLITPAVYQPLASPEIRNKGLRWMLNRNSPFHLKPRLDWGLVQWLWLFNRYCTTTHVEASKPFLYELQLYSLMLYQLMDVDLQSTCEQTGICFLSRTQQGLEALQQLAEEADELLQLPVELLTPEQLSAREQLSLNCTGGLYYANDAKVSPFTLCQHLSDYLKANGATVHTQCDIKQLEQSGKQVTAVIDTEGNAYHCDQFVFAGGAYTDELGRLFGKKIPLQAGKGFSFSAEKTTSGFNTPLLLLEDKIAVTPYADTVRFAGTMMLAGKDKSIDTRRVSSMRQSINRCFNDFALDENNTSETWAGLRPCSPDGLPIVGRIDEGANVIVATGHGMLGMSLGAATGQIVTQIIEDSVAHLAADKMRLDRF